MAKVQEQYSTTTRGNEASGGSNNNMFQSEFEKGFSADNIANGMGIAHPASLKPLENIPGSEASEQYMLKDREIARFNDLKSKAFGNPTISNAGIVLDSFGGSLGESGQGPSNSSSKSPEQSR